MRCAGFSDFIWLESYFVDYQNHNHEIMQDLLTWFKGVLHSLPKMRMFFGLSQNYRHLLEK